ncbi:hypothetical protein C5N14_01625 [Micromonospora sp. MW-13]|uniref:hypothetical protein n=1 Tax=Micromonospora sp. MW-13 TaxID=2094022 RepID=UPI000E440223|nr:hypothetical protein [Micromonospora sp. MW-13]RGC70820.1 hypothetical protein C5N14_01625 [Micromonospora sp. MW-13]
MAPYEEAMVPYVEPSQAYHDSTGPKDRLEAVPRAYVGYAARRPVGETVFQGGGPGRAHRAGRWGAGGRVDAVPTG